MLSKKLLGLGLAGILMAGMVGCGNEFDSTEYLDEQGKQLIKKYEDREKYNYTKIEKLDYMSESLYKDKYVMITGKVKDIDEEGMACYRIDFEFEENNSRTPIIRVFIQKNMIDVKFNKGDIITVYGKCYGIRTKRFEYKGENKSFDYWHIFGNFIELGDTTDENITKSETKDIKESTNDKDIVTKESSSTKTENTKDVSKEADVKNNTTTKSNDTKKDNKKDTAKEKTTPKKEEPKKKGYYVTCPNGHKVYTENGDWDCGQCYDEYQEELKNKPEQVPNDVDDNIDPETGLAKIKGGTQLDENEYQEEDIQENSDVEYYE